MLAHYTFVLSSVRGVFDVKYVSFLTKVQPRDQNLSQIHHIPSLENFPDQCHQRWVPLDQTVLGFVHVLSSLILVYDADRSAVAAVFAVFSAAVVVDSALTVAVVGVLTLSAHSVDFHTARAIGASVQQTRY